jgi:DNA invertase Pin-like site-specific DNA recombinase
MNSSEAKPVFLSGQYKITPTPLQRLAYIYIRQSTLKQVKENRESQVYQYHLRETAQALGWSQERVRVIDADQGHSGRESEHREGFKELVAEISLGHVGIIFGYEVSRLARNNRDWYHLMDLAAIFGTLLADGDGIYDLKLHNDRLLLGLKGTMSEAELHILRQRLEGGRLAQVKRGEYRQHLPTGLVRQADGSVVKDPDNQVRHVIELVLTKFVELGSCRRVLRYLRRAEVLLPRHQTSGLYKGELLWKIPSDAAIYDLIRNPAYAGAFAYGRTQLDPTRHDPSRPATGRLKKPLAEWLHLQHDVYPAYISWKQYLANQEQLHQNALHYRELQAQAQGIARSGVALLQGLVRCGQCGCALKVTYRHSHRYFCDSLTKRFDEPRCLSAPGPAVDAVVVQAFFQALQPAQLDALAAILSEQQLERQRLSQHWAERLKRAQYEARLAERQYQLVDPENRLVAAELERRWEQKLIQGQETQEAYQRFQQSSPPAEIPTDLRQQFQHISETLPVLWPALTNSHKKELLRSLIAQVILTRQAADRVAVKIVWVSGHYSLVHAQPPILREQDVTGYDQMVNRIETLWQQELADDQIAAQLTREGFHSARSLEVKPETVMKIRLAHHWHTHLARSRNILELDGYLTIRGLAARLGVERNWIYNRLKRGIIAPHYLTRHPQSQVYLIKDDPALIAQLKQLLAENVLS